MRTQRGGKTMATRTGNRSSTGRNRSSSSNRGGNRSSSSSSDRSAFSWGDSGALVGAAIAGAAIAVAANLGRKAAMQGMSAAAGDWDEVLAAEHDATMLILDKLLATDESKTLRRTKLVK